MSVTNTDSSDFGTYTVIESNDAGSVASNASLTQKDLYPPGSLYTQEQYEAALQIGFNLGLQVNDSDVLADPNNYDLYTLSQVQALHVDTPLLYKDSESGNFTLTPGLQKSADLNLYSPFPMTTPGTAITGDGKLKFTFPSSDDAAFYRLEAK